MTIRAYQTVAVVVVALLFAAPKVVSAECGILCGGFWKIADESAVRVALDRGANLDARDARYGWTPLHWAAGISHTPSTVALLLDRGANIEALDNDGWTPLHLAANSNSESSILELLLDRGANIEAREEDNLTPLHLAVLHNSEPSIVELLLDRGANPRARDKLGMTPFDWAQINDALVNTEIYWRLNNVQDN